MSKLLSFCSIFSCFCLFNFSIVSSKSLFVLASFITLFSFFNIFCFHPHFFLTALDVHWQVKTYSGYKKKHLDFYSKCFLIHPNYSIFCINFNIITSLLLKILHIFQQEHLHQNYTAPLFLFQIHRLLPFVYLNQLSNIP